MIDRARLCVTASVETVLNKLKKASVAAYSVKKQGAYVYFSVEEEYLQKVFAIFSHPCYNIAVKRKSFISRLKSQLLKRLGLPVGAALFVAACVISNSLLLKIKVVGNAPYLSDSIIAVAEQCGAKRGTFCASLDKPLLTSRILALPDVSFCSVQRSGGILIIEVRTGGQTSSNPFTGNFVSDCGGKILKIVAVSGTAEKQAGDTVSAGDLLIGAYGLTQEGERYPVPAVGWAEIEQKGAIALFFAEENEKNTADALAATSLYAEKVTQKSYRVSPCDGGVTYEVEFSYVRVISCNMQ